MSVQASNASPESAHVLNSSPETVAPTNPGTYPPTEVIIEQIASDVDSLGNTSTRASSSMPSQRSVRLAALFLLIT